MAESDFFEILLDRGAGVLAMLDAGAAHGVEQSAEAIVLAIQAVIAANGQIETGNMLHSVYYRTHAKSTYPGEGASDELLPEVDAPASATEASVSIAASYAVYQNYGTRYQPARPFMEPGAQDAVDAIDTIFQSLDFFGEGGEE